jgi:hypothetical protein
MSSGPVASMSSVTAMALQSADRQPMTTCLSFAQSFGTATVFRPIAMRVSFAAPGTTSDIVAASAEPLRPSVTRRMLSTRAFARI